MNFRLKSFLPLFFLLSSLQVSCQKRLEYTVDISNPSDDLFHVELLNPKLTKKDTLYQFAATAPGTYQVMDIGRFVTAFKVYDKNGNELPAERKSINQFRLLLPNKIHSIKYSVTDIWDSQITENIPWAMASTSIEADHALINAHCVIGFPITQQSSPISLQINYPSEWKIGTALPKSGSNTWLADNYDHLIDSPILIGRLSYATTHLNNTKIDIYTYSKTDVITSNDLLENMIGMLKAADAFLETFPVDRYTFLYHFEDKNAGAWEHSYSSVYVLPEYELSPFYAKSITSIASHEFFHIITPLNIHSEIIEKFNFTNPVPSKHLWLYEGITEWASDIMQLRGGLMDINQYLNQIQTKLNINDSYDKNYSLEKLALTSFEKEGNKQYSNIYSRGAIVATLLDIRLLELSNGKRGLREVINKLTDTYGKNQAFPENDFYNLFVQLTNPEIDDFIQNYIRGTKELPLEEYFSKIGIQYYHNFEKKNSLGEIVSTIKHHFEVVNNPTAEQKYLRDIWERNL